MTLLTALILGALADALFGDPRGFPHVVVGIGRLIAQLERILRRLFPPTPAGELAGGSVLAVLMCALSFASTWGLMYLCTLVHPLLVLIFESFLCWQGLALRSLRDESMAVYRELKKGDLPAARTAVGAIVGRDTGVLDSPGVIRAAVETVAENACDGVIAPMIYLALGGAPLGILYKAISTMDSMLGYKNARYLYFGRAAARLDDAANFLPSRLAALLMALAAPLVGLDGRNALRIFRRDRLKHKSPNSGQTESVCAGALHLSLGGDAYYFGELVHKETIGDDERPPEPEDIPRCNRLAAAASLICLILCATVRGVLLWS